MWICVNFFICTIPVLWPAKKCKKRQYRGGFDGEWGGGGYWFGKGLKIGLCKFWHQNPKRTPVQYYNNVMFNFYIRIIFSMLDSRSQYVSSHANRTTDS